MDAFTKDGRPELAEKERLEIEIIEAYLPQASGEEDIRKLVHGAIAHLQKDAGGVRPGPRDLGTAMQVAQQWIRAAGLRADRKLVSEIVKAELSKE
ncbi:GatB/YqeY domain-containing protein [Tunturiibacter gelidiferens]|uniref:GatB/YqeY domain-containing protein n=1 Tax=Tunturiibacter gelidiferens TaxID=3069689 RepID=UPI003D9BC50B